MHQRRSPTSRSAILLLLLASLFLVPASASDCLVVAQLFKTDSFCCGASTTSTKVTCDTYDEVTEIVHDARNASLDPSQMPTTCDIDVTLGLLKNLRNLTLVNLAVAAGPTACPGWVDWINNLDGLRFLNLTNNFLNESYFNMSSAFNNLKNLTTLILADNSFQTVPKFLANLPQLKALDLSTNSINASDITGPDLPNLERLNITLIYRTPPQMLSTFNSLKTLSVDFRPAFVPCPDVVLCSSLNSSFLNPISQMTWLENLAVISMDLVVPNSIPLWLRDFHALRTLTMRGCTLSGPLPDFLGTLDRLTFMDFSSNHLNGSIPESIYNANLTTIILDSNELEGDLPKFLYNVPNCQVGSNNYIRCPTLAESPALCVRCNVQLSWLANTFDQISSVMVVIAALFLLVALGYLFVLLIRRRSLPLSFLYVFLSLYHTINLVLCVFVLTIRFQLANALLIALAFGCSVAWNLHVFRIHTRGASILPVRGISFQLVRVVALLDINNILLYQFRVLFPNSMFVMSTRRMIAYSVPQVLLSNFLPLVIVSMQLNIWIEGFFLMTAIVASIAIVRSIAQAVVAVVWGKEQEAMIQAHRRAEGINLEDRQ